jgi:hypothetical protein
MIEKTKQGLQMRMNAQKQYIWFRILRQLWYSHISACIPFTVQIKVLSLPIVTLHHQFRVFYSYESQRFIMGIKTDITLYTEGTPNGLKTSIVLEELGLEYKVWSQ